MKVYPKVLVIGNTFHTKSGGGITMSNLFKGWPKDKIAAATNNIALSEAEVCNKYYQLGNLEDVRPWVFKLFQKKVSSGQLLLFTYRKKKFFSTTYRNVTLSLNERIHFTVEKILMFLGMYHFVYKLKISDEFIGWIDQYRPDVIYAQVSSLALVRFINKVYDRLRIPYVIHLMDDHYKTMVKGGVLKPYWNNIMKNEYAKLINNAAKLMSICEMMSDEYRKRFQREFIPFHNPIETKKWLGQSKYSWQIENEFVVLYAGRIGLGTSNSLTDVATAVEELNHEGLRIRFDLQLNSNNSIPKLLLNLKHTFVNTPVSYEDLPKRFYRADLLVLPIDFDKRSLQYIRYSMPTKTSEFMITGVPIMIYAPKETALVDYAKRDDWAFIVDERGVQNLKNAFLKLYKDRTLRERLGQRARQLAIENHDADQVCGNFRSLLQQAAS